MLYSQDLEPYSEDELSPEIKGSLAALKKIIGDFEVLRLNEHRIAIPFKLKVELPPNGVIGGIDIKSYEHLLLTLNIKDYPLKAPGICSDRKDFPSTHLSHLYAVKSNTPSNLCLIRGSIDEWYSNHSISDIIYLAEEWFHKAVVGDLNSDGSEFEPIRLEGYSGHFIYHYSTIAEIVNKDWRFNKDQPFALIYQSISKDPTYNKKDDLNYKAYFAIPKLQLPEVKKNIQDAKSNKSDENLPEKPLIGLLCWAHDHRIEHGFFNHLPKNYGELEKFCQKLGINIYEAVKMLQKLGLQRFNGIPLTIAIRRPAPIIGQVDKIEFLSFTLSGKSENFNGQKLKNTTRITLKAHREPLSEELARRISDSEMCFKSLMVGAGSLGSKIGIHFGRKGNRDLVFIDNERLEPHNLVRHALHSSSLGESKAKELGNTISSFYQLSSKKSRGFESSIFRLSPEQLNKFDWIIDSTASHTVFHWLVSLGNSLEKNVCRVEIADNGRLGLLFIEGEQRNPRIDDLRYLLYSMAEEQPEIMQWLKREKKRRISKIIDEFVVGIGCNSESMVVADDQISLHAAAFSRVLENVQDRKHIQEKGLIFVQYLDEEGIINTQNWNRIVPSFLEIECKNGSGWLIRIENGVHEKILNEADKKAPDETGGILVGVANYKLKVIHVVKNFEAPPDSSGSRSCFIRGTQELPEQISNFRKKTGNTLGYIGEWHSHPMGLESLSSVDKDSVKKLKVFNDKIPIPTLMMITSNNKLLPFIFD